MERGTSTSLSFLMSNLFRAYSRHGGKNTMNRFTEEVITQLRYYVYILVNPIDHTVFYIGKGTKNRVFAHELDYLKTDFSNDLVEKQKLNEIKTIHSNGMEVEKYILTFGLSEDEAFHVENAVINFCKLIDDKKLNVKKLTNIMSGHRSDGQKETLQTFGRVELLQDALSPKPVNINQLSPHKIMFVKIKPTKDRFDSSKDLKAEEMYNPESEALKKRTLGDWVMSLDKANSIEYILGIYPGSGMIVSAFKIIKDNPRYEVLHSTTKSGRKQKRYNFYQYAEPLTEIVGIQLFPDHIKLTNYQYVNSNGVPCNIQSERVYVGFD